MTTHRFLEKSAGRIFSTLKDSNDDVVPGSRITVCELTLWNLETSQNTSLVEGIINARRSDDVLGSGEVTISESGAFIWYLAPEDNVIINSRRQVERHRATLHFEWTTDTDDGTTNVELEIEVENLRRIV